MAQDGQAAIADPLSHLPPCPKCGFHLSAPVLCKGVNHPEHVDFWYRPCLNNSAPFVNTCDGFYWEEDMPVGREAGLATIERRCRGVMCAMSTRPKDINVNCLFALCKQCCVRAHQTLPAIRPCNIGDHRRGTPAPVRHPPAAHPGPPGTPRGASSVPPLASARPPSTDFSTIDPALLHPPSATDFAPAIDPALLRPSALPTERYQPVSKQHRVSISPGYLARIKDTDAQQKGNQEDADNEARLEKENSHNAEVAWWHKNGEPAELFEIRVLNWPAFHPKNSSELVESFDLKSNRFQYFDNKSRTWFSGSWNSPSRNVKTCGPLLYRTLGVTEGPNMPAAANPLKRPGSGVFDDDTDQSKRSSPSTPQHYYAPRTPSSRRTHGPRRTTSTPSVGALARESEASESPFASTSSVPPSRTSSFSTPSHSRGRSSNYSTPSRSSSIFSRASSVVSSRHSPSPSPSTPSRLFFDSLLLETPHRETVPRPTSPRDDSNYEADFGDGPLPSLWPELVAAQTSFSPTSSTLNLPILGPSTASSPVPSPARAVPPLPSTSGVPTGSSGTPPPGPRGPFPFRYVCDMADRFDTMLSLQADGVKQEIAFQLAFELPFKKSTFSDNHAIWRAAAAIPGEQDRWRGYGRTERGEWTRFTRAMRN